MKIGVIGFFQLRTMQYLTKYTDILDELGVEYDVVHWSRSNDDIPPTFKGKHIVFNYEMLTEQPFYKKIGGFLRYAHFMRKTIRENKYDKLIVLTTQTAVSLCDLLLGKYKKKYIYGFYDLTKENNKLFCYLVKWILASAECATVSSIGFMEKIGYYGDNIQQAHNTQFLCNKSEFSANKPHEHPIHIVYWGIIRQLNFNKRICDYFGGDKRFCVIFHGNGVDRELEEYCKDKGYSNIAFTGKYSRKDIPKFVSKTDILNCIYENDYEMESALQVKLYDAIHYRLPLLVSAHSYVSEFGKGLSGLYEFDLCKTTADDICDWYRNNNVEDINYSYEEYEKRIYNDDITFRENIVNFVTRE